MSNVDRLKQAGIILPAADLSDKDEDIVNSLSDDEVKALISIKKKVPADFLKRNCDVDSIDPGPAARIIGIVF